MERIRVSKTLDSGSYPDGPECIDRPIGRAPGCNPANLGSSPSRYTYVIVMELVYMLVLETNGFNFVGVQVSPITQHSEVAQW